MRTTQLFSLVLLAIATLTLAWTKEDHEIFRLRDDIISHEGPDTTFYSFVGLQPGASSDAIEKAYRKRSRQLHPDKAVQAAIAARSLPKKSTSNKPGVTVTKAASAKEKAQITKEVTERYARLSVVGSILRGPSRQRYDHFLRNGFPRWRGSGYYYERFRPGLVSVLLGLLVTFGGAVHYGAMYISAKRQREFVQRYISHARRTAWGNESGVPGINEGLSGSSYAPPPEEMNNAALPINRRQKRMQDKDNRKNNDAAKSTRILRIAKKQEISPPVDAEPIAGPQGAKKKVIAENGKVLIVDSTGQVFLQESTQEGQAHEYLLDPEEIAFPTIYQTVLFRLPIWVYQKSAGRFISPVDVAPLSDLVEDLTIPNPEDNIGAILGASTAANQNGEARKRKNKAMQRSGEMSQ